MLWQLGTASANYLQGHLKIRVVSPDFWSLLESLSPRPYETTNSSMKTMSSTAMTGLGLTGSLTAMLPHFELIMHVVD